MITVEGTLPVAMVTIDGQTAVKSKKIIMRSMTAAEYLLSQSETKEGQYLKIADLAAMTKLIDSDGKEHIVTYDMLAHSSRLNLEYLSEKRDELEAKERAEE